MSSQEIEVIVVGAGQAGVAMSDHLTDRGIPHLVLEKGRIAVQQLFAHQPGKQSRIVLPIELVVRASTGPVPH